MRKSHLFFCILFAGLMHIKVTYSQEKNLFEVPQYNMLLKKLGIGLKNFNTPSMCSFHVIVNQKLLLRSESLKTECGYNTVKLKAEKTNCLVFGLPQYLEAIIEFDKKFKG